MRVTAVPLLGLFAACAAVPSSSVWTPGPAAPPPEAEVRLSFVADPEGAEEVGVVEVNGRRPFVALDSLVGELKRRVASIGGDLARVDRFATVHETITENYTYDCSETVTKTERRLVTRSVSSPGFPGTGVTTAGGLETRTETVTTTERKPKTCKGTRRLEVATLTLTARAFRNVGATR